MTGIEKQLIDKMLPGVEELFVSAEEYADEEPQVPYDDELSNIPF